jgi:hypothetical protein
LVSAPRSEGSIPCDSASLRSAYDFGRAYSWGTDFSAGAYFDFKGYLFRSDGGFRNSANAMVRVWGLPNFSIGLCALWKAFSLGTVDFMTAYGLEYTHYFQTEKTSAPGFGASIRASFDIPVGDGLDLCVGGVLNASSHAKAKDVEDPSSTFYPFKLLEFGPAIGLALSY